MKIKIDATRLKEAVGQGIITERQAEALWKFLCADTAEDIQSPEAGSGISRLLFYMGAFIVIGAMTWFVSETWEKFGGSGVACIAAGYASLFLFFSRRVRRYSETLAGLFVVMAVCMTPLAVYGVQKATGLWLVEYPGTYRNFYTYLKSGWFAMELATIAAGLLSLRFAKIPFAVFPVAFSLWFMSMDITPVLFESGQDWQVRRMVSVWFGLGMILVAVLTDRRTRVDYAKWLYIFGAVSFWLGLSLLDSQSEIGKIGYCAVNVLLTFVGVLLERRVFVVLGAIGVFGYIGHLAWQVFRGSILFPFVLSGVGLAIIYLGWIYRAREARIAAFVRRMTPLWLIRLLPQNRE